MRLMFGAVALALAAQPAAAQKLDTGRTDIVSENGGLTATCGFTAVPGLELTQIGDTPYSAIWSGPARETGAATLNLMFVALPTFEAELMVASVHIGLPTDDVTVASATARFDGKDSGIAFEITPMSDDATRYAINPDTTDGYLAKLSAASTLDLELLDEGDKPIARYSWDISRLRLIPPLLSATRWRCTD